MKTYSLYLSTLSSNSKVLNKSNLANVRWNVNWAEIFGDKKGYCNVRIKLVSASGTYVENTHIGSVRATFASNYSNNSNGVNIGNTEIKANGAVHTIVSDMYYSNGQTIQIPTGNGEFQISMLDRTESLMTTFPEYQIWFYFDCKE